MSIRIASPKAELAAVHAVCTAGESIRARLLARLRDEHFHHGPAVAAWRRIRAVARSRQTIPAWVDVLEDTALDKDSRRILVGYEPTRKVKTRDDVADITRLLNKYRAVRHQLAIADMIVKATESDSEGYDPDKVTDAIGAAYAQLRSGASMVEDHLIRFGADDNANELVDEALDQSILPRLTPSGFRTWDDVNGGFIEGSLVVIGGTTGGGKSTVASVQMLKNMARYGPACLVPLEMTKMEMTHRLIANAAGIDIGKVIQKKLSAAEVSKAHAAMDAWRAELRAADSNYQIYEPPEDQTMEEILYGLEIFKYRTILIDYVSLLKDVNGDDSWRQLGEAARFAKSWAKRTGTIVILLVQLSDEGVIRYSKAIKEHANNAWFFVATQESRQEGELAIDQHKARNQNPFPFRLGIDYATMRVYDIGSAPPGVVPRGQVGADDEDVPPLYPANRDKQPPKPARAPERGAAGTPPPKRPAPARGAQPSPARRPPALDDDDLPAPTRPSRKPLTVDLGDDDA